ncbi:uncharacterized protein N7515_003810 [Penicillium bovifimosum]|uniref:Uncharacterized protein n=1 Tax=Penicillium bovifimosum TaxID=126998 RepID=A0A9W9H5D1_9EURO|nr:uncharacterized protein N7515_003810 [Penicillium bovifimosum]KAJ5138962.1 hypothetical protein N7515_003810 [Penicillium bovifimosum]
MGSWRSRYPGLSQTSRRLDGTDKLLFDLDDAVQEDFTLALPPTDRVSEAEVLTLLGLQLLILALETRAEDTQYTHDPMLAANQACRMWTPKHSSTEGSDSGKV